MQCENHAVHHVLFPNTTRLCQARKSVPRPDSPTCNVVSQITNILHNSSLLPTQITPTATKQKELTKITERRRRSSKRSLSEPSFRLQSPSIVKVVTASAATRMSTPKTRLRRACSCGINSPPILLSGGVVVGSDNHFNSSSNHNCNSSRRATSLRQRLERRNTWTVFHIDKTTLAIIDKGPLVLLESTSQQQQPLERRFSLPQVCSRELFQTRRRRSSGPVKQVLSSGAPVCSQQHSLPIYKQRAYRKPKSTCTMAGCSHGSVSQNLSALHRARTFMEVSKMPGRDSAYSSDGENDLIAPSTSRMIPLRSATRNNQLKRTQSLWDRKSTSSVKRSVPDIRSQNNKSTSICTPSIIKEKMRSMKETIRKHAVQSLTHGADWPPPQTIFGDRYFSNPSIAMLSEVSLASDTPPITTINKGATRFGSCDKSIRSKPSSSSSVSNPSLSGIVVSDNDLRAIIASVKKHVANSTSPKSADDVKSKNAKTFFPPKRILRKQSSFDDKEFVFVRDIRKVSVIQEEIDNRGFQSFVTNSESALDSSTTFLPNLQKFKKPPLPFTSTINADKDIITQELSIIGTPSNKIEVNSNSGDVTVISSEYLSTTENTSQKENSNVLQIAPPHEIEYDECGQTWDIYGAEIDPEMLGDAIERHLNAAFQRQNEHINSLSLDSTASNEEEENGAQMMTERKRLPYFLKWCFCHNERRDTRSSGKDYEMIYLQCQQKCV